MLKNEVVENIQKKIQKKNCRKIILYESMLKFCLIFKQKFYFKFEKVLIVLVLIHSFLNTSNTKLSLKLFITVVYSA